MLYKINKIWLFKIFDGQNLNQKINLNLTNNFFFDFLKLNN